MWKEEKMRDIQFSAKWRWIKNFWISVPFFYFNTVHRAIIDQLLPSTLPCTSETHTEMPRDRRAGRQPRLRELVSRPIACALSASGLRHTCIWAYFSPHRNVVKMNRTEQLVDPWWVQFLLSISIVFLQKFRRQTLLQLRKLVPRYFFNV